MPVNGRHVSLDVLTKTSAVVPTLIVGWETTEFHRDAIVDPDETHFFEPLGELAQGTVGM